MSEFLAMGGYGFYVWGAYGVTAVMLALEVIALRAGRRRALAEVQAMLEETTSGHTAEVMS